MNKTTISSTILRITLTLSIALFVLFLYTFLHESGHALTGAFFGQSLAEFDLSLWDLSAHIHMVGGELTEPQLAVQAVAGAGLPLIVWGIFISLVPRKASFTLEVLKLLSSMVVVNTLLAWISLSILFFLQKAPPDDVTSFLRHSQMPPLLLTFLAMLLYAGGWILFLSKIDGLRNELLLFSTTDRGELLSRMPKSLAALTGIMAFCIVAIIALNSLAGRNSINRFAPPQDFVQIAQIDLSKQAYPFETLTQFTVNEPTYIGVFIVIREINTTYFDLSVTGANGFSSTVVHGEGYSTAQDGGLWEQSLAAGTYQVVLTAHQSPGSVSVYIKTD